nr:DUF4291 family protein [Streptomyces sp. MMG1533]
MMYRCGWGAKAGQETVLAVGISRDGFEWGLRHACLSGYVRGVYPDRATCRRQLKRAPARVRWDPERDLRLQPLPYRSLQLGLSGEAARRYADEWTVAVRDVTPLAHEIHALVELDRRTSHSFVMTSSREISPAMVAGQTTDSMVKVPFTSSPGWALKTGEGAKSPGEPLTLTR